PRTRRQTLEELRRPAKPNKCKSTSSSTNRASARCIAPPCRRGSTKSTSQKLERSARASYRSQLQPAAVAESSPPAPGLPEESSFKTHTQCLYFLAEHTCSPPAPATIFGRLGGGNGLLLFSLFDPASASVWRR